MKRAIEKELWLWRDRTRRSPLIIRGARQVGKSYLVEKFGRDAFKDCVVVNFELQPELSSCFESLDPAKILEKLKIFMNTRIELGETLLFLDEIQQCPRALMALRYFKEKLPNLHVIAAGSLLEFSLEDKEFSFPVGRVEFLHLYPMSFLETLEAMGHEELLKQMGNWSVSSPPEPATHAHCLSLIRSYLFVGGMPAIVDLYKRDQDLKQCERYQSALMKTYRDDFGKYSQKTKHKYLQRILDRAPFLIGKQFRYSKVDPEIRSRDLKLAVDQLSQANLITRIYSTAANGLPLRSEVNEKKFKILFLDVGLLQLALGSLGSEMLKSNLVEIHRGALAEQFVAQELLAYSEHYLEKELHFWHREKKSSSAEVDYVIGVENQIVPIEVKGGATGHMRSLRLFMNEKKIPIGVRISQAPLSYENQILSVPFYLICALPRLIQSALNK